MSRYRPYPKYKDSGVDWLGEIPGDWSVKKLKYISNIQTGTTPSTTDESNFSDTDGIPWIKPDELDSFCSLVESKKYLTQNGLKSARLIRKNSVLVCGIGTIGKFGVAGRDLTTNQQINSVTFNKLLLPEFGKFLISSSEKEMDKFANGNVVKILNTESQKNIFYPYPSIQDQQSIANFLDNATCKIDTLIQKQQNLIELLKEKRQALISHAVTKGLNPHVKMKDSGVEWLGEVPEHWETERLKYLCQITTGNKDTENKEDCGEYHFYVRSQTIERINSYSYDGEAILTAGDGVGVGKVFHYVNGKFDYHQRVYMFYKFSKVKGKYLFEYMKNNLYKVALEGGAKSTVDSLRLPLLQNFMITVPSQEEQENIINYLDNATCKIDTLIAKAQEAIELLKERRTALISATVTGKIDVREITE